MEQRDRNSDVATEVKMPEMEATAYDRLHARSSSAEHKQLSLHLARVHRPFADGRCPPYLPFTSARDSCILFLQACCTCLSSRAFPLRFFSGSGTLQRRASMRSGKKAASLSKHVPYCFVA